MNEPVNIPDEELVDFYRSMLRIRLFEERLSQDFKAGKLPGPVHVYIGQEAVAVGLCAHLSDVDWITSTHRGHGHFLAKGGAPEAFIHEIYGRGDGICGGKGGSMHVADVSKGILGANGIVGGGIGLATGAALAAQCRGTGAVAVAFFGDGAANQGVVAEALNVAALWRLPLVLVCENNGYSEFSRARDMTAGRLTDRAAAYGVPAEEVDGNDVLAVWQSAARMVERARGGHGPSMLEARTYRLHGHVESEASFLSRPYRDADEVETWRARDPIAVFAARLLETGSASRSALDAIERETAETVDLLAETAEIAPWPKTDRAFTQMFV